MITIGNYYKDRRAALFDIEAALKKKPLKFKEIWALILQKYGFSDKIVKQLLEGLIILDKVKVKDEVFYFNEWAPNRPGFYK